MRQKWTGRVYRNQPGQGGPLGPIGRQASKHARMRARAHARTQRERTHERTNARKQPRNHARTQQVQLRPMRPLAHRGCKLTPGKTPLIVIICTTRMISLTAALRLAAG